MQEHWDVIVVGARCAGATLATCLARSGLRVLVLEAAARGTNMPMSTHFVQPPGMDVLDRLGLGERVRAVTPASLRFRYALDDAAVVCDIPQERAPYCVRRSTLDPWLQDTAEAAGAELRFNHRVIELIRSDARVSGVVARAASGPVELHADLVVGADGMRSTIAQLTGAPEYLVTEGTRAGYFAYYPAPQRWTNDWDSTLEHTGDDLRYVFRCDGDSVLLTYVGKQAEVASWPAAEREQHFARALAGSPSTQALCEGKRALGPTIGMLRQRFFYRQPIGPGYALVGDAGHFKDFVTGQGMADAFLDAERLALSIVDGRPGAFEHYWRERDIATMPLHFDALRQGEVGFNEPCLRAIIGRFAERPELRARLVRMLDRTLDPAELVPARTLLSVLLSALVQGRVDVFRGFMRTARSRFVETRERKERMRLLQVAQAELDRQAKPSAITSNAPMRAIDGAVPSSA